MKIKPLFRSGMALAPLLLLASASGGADRAAPAGYASDDDVDAAVLRAAVEPLFAADAEAGETRAVIVLHDGHVLAERYANGFGPGSRMLSWSVAKTVTALLIGIMVSDGRLALDAPVPVAAWRQSGDPRGAITLRQMLTMSSGIAHTENEEPIENSDALRMLVGDGAADMARYAEAKPLAREPGAAFRYDSATTLILCDMMTALLTGDRDAIARRDAMTRFAAQRLAGPAGLGSLVSEYDASGTMIGAAMVHMTARDYARLGELLRNRGRVDGHQIVSARWTRFMTTPSAANPAYGGHIWLNRPGAEHVFFPGEAPRDIFAAIGLRGQYVIVSPSQRLTVVRLGVTSEDEMPALRRALLAIVRAAPSRARFSAAPPRR